jgi:ketosteroid isomerase-like protein
MAKATTESVFQHHMQAVQSGNVDEVLKDYSKDSVIFTPTETCKGLESIKASFQNLINASPAEAMANIKTTKLEIRGEYVYLLWTMPPAIPFAGDTFHIHNGKIMMQSVIFSAGK